MPERWVMPDPIPASHPWPSNAHLIEACAALGYLRNDARTWDPTYGFGTFWRRWWPDFLLKTDRDPAKSIGPPADVTMSSAIRRTVDTFGSFDAITFDPPYRLNGRPDTPSDDRYGVQHRTRWQDRMAVVTEGTYRLAEALRPGGHLLVKCQAQVVSGHVVWQDREVADAGERAGLILVDRLDMTGQVRKQPPGRRQVHAQRRPSTMLVLRRPR